MCVYVCIYVSMYVCVHMFMYIYVLIMLSIIIAIYSVARAQIVALSYVEDIKKKKINFNGLGLKCSQRSHLPAHRLI